MNVLVLTRIFPSKLEPSRGLYNFHRFRALSQLCPTRVVVPVPFWHRVTSPWEWVGPRFDHYQGLEVTYPTYWMVPKLAPQLHAGAMYRSIRSYVLEILTRLDVDVILGAFAYPDIVVAARLAKDTGCPLVGLVMGSDVNELAQRSQLRHEIYKALAEADCVIALSAALKDRVVELGIPEHRVIVQRNGVDGDRFAIRDRSQARKHLGLLPDGRVACFVGNLVPEKGPDILLEAVGLLDQSCLSSLEVIFVGDGRLKNRLRSRAKELGLGTKVRFVGRRSPDEIPLWMTAADVLCLPSRREGCPNVLLEALASGRPVVANSVGGVPELLNDRNGLVVAPEDVSAFAKAMTTALHRAWEPTELRASVPSLTWGDLGCAFYDVLAASVRRADEKRQITSRFSVETVSRLIGSPLTKK